MSYLNLLKVAIRAILSNKFRSFLSMLGIIIGVAAVIIMMAIGQGSKENVKAELSKMGTNLLTIRPGAERRFAGARPDPASLQTLKEEDVEAIKREATLITYVSAEVTASGQVIYGNKNTTATLYGESPDYLEIKKWELAEGDCFTEEDCIKNAKVCVVGTTVVEQLFGDKNYNCIGKNIRFKNIPFRIVGILKSKGYNNWGMDQDNLLIAPNTTVMKRVAAQTWYSSIAVSALSEEMSEAAIEELKEILRRSHKIKEGDEDNFTIRSQKEMMEMMNSTANVMTTLLLCVACISLIVGGIGIMNIMLVSVTERTKEIGLRMSVGARGIDILSQFLIEAVLMSITGGIIGVLFGMLITYGITTFAQWPVQIQPWSVMLSFAVCTFTGIFFGWYPAKKAANLDPIEAIRYE